MEYEEQLTLTKDELIETCISFTLFVMENRYRPVIDIKDIEKGTIDSLWRNKSASLTDEELFAEFEKRNT